MKPFQSDKYVNKEGPENGMSSQARQMGSPSCLLWVSFCLMNSAQLRCFCWICWVPISTALAGLTVAVSAWLGEDAFFPWCIFTHGVLREENLAHQMALVQKTPATHEILLWMWLIPLERVKTWPLCHLSPLHMWNFFVRFCQMHTWSLFLILNTPTFVEVAFSSISFHHSKALIKDLLLQQSRLIQFRFYLLKNNHLPATEKEEKNLSLKIWWSVSL